MEMRGKRRATIEVAKAEYEANAHVVSSTMEYNLLSTRSLEVRLVRAESVPENKWSEASKCGFGHRARFEFGLHARTQDIVRNLLGIGKQSDGRRLQNRWRLGCSEP